MHCGLSKTVVTYSNGKMMLRENIPKGNTAEGYGCLSSVTVSPVSSYGETDSALDSVDFKTTKQANKKWQK